ncbi:MAG: hypothetical protein JSW08_00430 [archaeon]|nr:MAG: hypothetical protein JSW08_00430 [archaeon]
MIGYGEKHRIEEVKPGLFIQTTPKGGYKMVRPPVKDLNKPMTKDNIHWKRFLIGSWGNIIKIAIIIAILLGLWFGYQADMEGCHKIMESECLRMAVLSCFAYEAGYEEGLNLTFLFEEVMRNETG